MFSLRSGGSLPMHFSAPHDGALGTRIQVRNEGLFFDRRVTKRSCLVKTPLGSSRRKNEQPGHERCRVRNTDHSPHLGPQGEVPYGASGRHPIKVVVKLWCSRLREHGNSHNQKLDPTFNPRHDFLLQSLCPLGDGTRKHNQTLPHSGGC